VNELREMFWAWMWKLSNRKMTECGFIFFAKPIGDKPYFEIKTLQLSKTGHAEAELQLTQTPSREVPHAE
jgi:hypothetical protein